MDPNAASTTPAPQGSTTPPTPAAGQSGGQSTTPPATPAPEAQAQPAAAQPQPYRTFATEDDLTKFVQGAKGQAERAAVRKLAKDLGFEDADEMRDALATLRHAQGGGNLPPAPPATEPPATTASTSAETARLQMALKVGAELNLPAALINRLQGDTEAAMKADAESLVALMGSGTPANRMPGIPPVPAGNQPVTFTRTQLQDAKFVRENAEAIRQAASQGRIVNS